MKITVGIVVGHNSKNQGAVAYTGETEYSLCSRAALAIHQKQDPHVNYEIIYRDEKLNYYEQCKKVAKTAKLKRCHLVLCLHFNSFNKKASGSEALILSDYSSNSNIVHFCKKFINNLEKLGIRKRHSDGIAYINCFNNGFRMLSSLKKEGIQAAILEPCFIHYQNKEFDIFIDDIGTYGQVIEKALHELVWGKIDS